jgi:hypothetical protein
MNTSSVLWGLGGLALGAVLGALAMGGLLIGYDSAQRGERFYN